MCGISNRRSLNGRREQYNNPLPSLNKKMSIKDFIIDKIQNLIHNDTAATYLPYLTLNNHMYDYDLLNIKNFMSPFTSKEELNYNERIKIK